MRRWVWGLGVVGTVLTGCKGVMDRLSAHADTAAEVGVAKLSAERVATVLGKSGGAPTLQQANLISNIWLDYALFGQTLASSGLKSDSATIARVMWPEIAQARVRVYHDSVSAIRSPVLPTMVDSLYGSPDVRAFQHIIIIPKGASKNDTALAEKAIADVLAKARGGANFGQLAAQNSADGSKNDQGFLPVGGKGQFVKQFEDAAWALAPGQLSGVVKSQFGFHVIRRPSLTEARDRFETYLRNQVRGKSDSVYIAELARDAGINVAAGAQAAIREAAADPIGAKSSTRALVSMKDGNLSVGEFVRWAALFPPQAREQLRTADDSMLAGFAKGLAQNVLLLRMADKAKTQIKPEQWKFVELKYNQSVETIRQTLGLSAPELSDSSKLTVEQKTTFAAGKVDEYFERLISGRAQMQMLLPELAMDLRMGGVGRVNQAGVSRAVELAMAQFRRDSASTANKATAQPQVEKAPGGPPIGGGTPPKPGAGPR
jgi:parvulin-like peptidyl-prolyl isomerase